MNAAAEIASKMTEKGDFFKANVYCQKTMRLLYKLSYGVDVYNVLKNVKLEDETTLSIIMNDGVRTALNLSTNWTYFNFKVYDSVAEDFMRPVTDLGNFFIL